jgi:hypothetical protein
MTVNLAVGYRLTAPAWLVDTIYRSTLPLWMAGTGGGHDVIG